MSTNYFSVFLLASISFIGCNDSSPVIEVEESENPPLTKQDSVAQAQASLKDSLRTQGWYSFNTFGAINRDYFGFESYNWSILAPPLTDSSFYSESFFPEVIRMDYESSGNILSGVYTCFSDTPGFDCIERFEGTQHPDETEFLITNHDDTVGFFFSGDPIQNSNTILLHLPLPYDSSRMGLIYTIWYDKELESTALAIARSAHKFR